MDVGRLSQKQAELRECERKAGFQDGKHSSGPRIILCAPDYITTRMPLCVLALNTCNVSTTRIQFVGVLWRPL